MNEFVNRIGLNLDVKNLTVLECQYDEEGKLAFLKVKESRSEDEEILTEGTPLEANTLNTIIRNMIIEEFNILNNNYQIGEKNIDLSIDDDLGYTDSITIDYSGEIELAVENSYVEFLEITRSILTETPGKVNINFKYILSDLIDNTSEFQVPVKIFKKNSPTEILLRMIYNITVIGTSFNPED